MNKQRRKEIDRIYGELEQLRATAVDLSNEIDTLQSEEQDAHDGMPESVQNGERGEKSQEAADALQSAIDSLSTVDDEIGSVLEYLETARGES